MTRERFINEILAEISVEPVNVPIAFRAGRIDGSLQSMGIRVSLGDLLIGATALELGFEVLMSLKNARLKITAPSRSRLGKLLKT